MTTDTLRITGGATPRTGTLQANGAPEAALPMLAAAAALKRPVTLSPVPATTAIQAMTTLIEACGWAVTRTGRRVRVVPGNFHDGYPAADLGAAATLPGSRYLAVPLLAAYGRTQLPWPCDAPGSEHPMDLIFKVLEHFGDTATAHEHGYRIEAGQGPHTVEIALPEPSRPATITALLRAATLPATTVAIYNADLSPTTTAVLGALLGAGHRGRTSTETDSITLSPSPGPDSTKRLVWQVPGDPIEAATLVCAVLATGGDAEITGVDARELIGFARLLSDAGLHLEPDKDRLHARTVARRHDRPWAGIRAHTGHGPRALNPELAPLSMALALHTPGNHKLEDQTNPQRHSHLVTQFEAMGAQIIRANEACASFTGPQLLHGARVAATDPYTAAALIIAALGAHGTTTLTGARHLHAGYTDLPATLAALGAATEEGGA